MRSEVKDSQSSHLDDKTEIFPNLIDEKTEIFPSLIDIKRKIPKKCFESSPLVSLYYALKDLVCIFALYALVLLGDKFSDSLHWSLITKALLWPSYWFLQGTMMWALFVIAHDCGHGSFSNSSFLNDTVGNILNTFILVPYYPWKLSHKHHHKNTGNIDKDEIFYPIRRRVEKEQNIQEDEEEKCDRSEGTQRQKRKTSTFTLPYWGLGASWFLYLVMGYSRNDSRSTNHFNPWILMFKGHTAHVLISLVLWFTWVLFALPLYAFTFGVLSLLTHYLLPVFIFASWLFIVTFLHHQDVDVMWYADHKWDFVRGNLSSVDRHYGWAHNLTHNIGTHQIHHLFIKIPHYHLEEATHVFRSHYPHLIKVNRDGILKSFAKMFSLFITQMYISSKKEYHVYKDSKIE